MAVYLFWPSPSFRGTKYDHGPARTRSVAGGAGVLLQRTNFEDALLQSRSHFLMHRSRVIAFDEVRFVTVSGQQSLQFFMRDAGKDGGICDLVAVQMQHRQDGPIAN